MLIRGQDQDAIPGELRIAWLRDFFPKCPSFWSTTIAFRKRATRTPRFSTAGIRRFASRCPPGLTTCSPPRNTARAWPRCSARMTFLSIRRGRPCRFARCRFAPTLWRTGAICRHACGPSPARVCLLGPEAPGKTAGRATGKPFRYVLRRRLRGILRELQNELTPADVQRLARAEWAAEFVRAPGQPRTLSRHRPDGGALLERTPVWLVSRLDLPGSAEPAHDLYLVPDLKAPLVGEPWHSQTEAQRAFWQRCVETLEKRGVAYVR